MDLTKEGIKLWLKTAPHSRAWLGEKCGNVSERAVNNWLSSPRPIPARVLSIIKTLMDEEAESAQSKQEASASERPSLILRPTELEFDEWTAAFKESAASTLREWALDGLNGLAKEWKKQQAAAPPYHSSLSMVADEPAEYKIRASSSDRSKG